MTDGVILIDKPQNITSFGVVNALRLRLGVKCGHCGTLDPLATGLLPVMCGKATKLCNYLTNGDKAYRATLRFGVETDTHDITGSVVRCDDKDITSVEIERVIPDFTGKIRQLPPAYSAIKVGGKPLYKLARNGAEFNIPEREITVYSIGIVDFSQRELIIDVECSKGTYIRSLCRDIARALGTVGTMSALRRIKTCGWSVDNAILPDAPDLAQHIISMDEVLCDFPPFKPEPFFANLLKNGCAVSVNKLKNLPLTQCRVYDGDALLGLGEIIETGDGECLKLTVHL